MNAFNTVGGGRMAALVKVIVLLGMLVVVPLGLRLIDGLPAWSGRVWLVGGAFGGFSLWLPRGLPAAAFAAVYALLTVGLAVLAARRLVQRSPSAREVAVLTALGTPAVGGLALVAERYGYRLFDFDFPVLALTVAHFHFAGFAAALVAGLVCAAAGDRPAARVAALSVPVGTGVVLVGFFVGDAVELAGTAVLSAGMWLVAWLTWTAVRPAVTGRGVRALLAVAAVVPVVSMLLALSWALGRATDLPHPSLDWMVATHGLANALGFALCSILAWRLIPRSPHWTS